MFQKETHILHNNEQFQIFQFSVCSRRTWSPLWRLIVPIILTIRNKRIFRVQIFYTVFVPYLISIFWKAAKKTKKERTIVIHIQNTYIHHNYWIEHQTKLYIVHRYIFFIWCTYVYFCRLFLDFMLIISFHLFQLYLFCLWSLKLITMCFFKSVTQN